MKHSGKGYTLTELVMVIVLMGLISAVSVPLFFNRDTYLLRYQHDQLLSDLQLARQVAVASGCSIQIDIRLRSYSALYDSACSSTAGPDFSQPLQTADGSPVAVTLSSDFLFSAPQQFIFTPQGMITETSGSPISSRLLRLLSSTESKDLTLFGTTGLIR